MPDSDLDPTEPTSRWYYTGLRRGGGAHSQHHREIGAYLDQIVELDSGPQGEPGEQGEQGEQGEPGGVTVIGFDIPEVVIPDVPTWAEVDDDYRLEIPARAYILAWIITARLGEPMAEGETAALEYRFYNDADWDAGVEDPENNTADNLVQVASSDANTEGQLRADALSSPQYGLELLRGMLVYSASDAGGVFTDVSVRALYVETLSA